MQEKRVALLTDSGSDLSDQQLLDNDIRIIPLRVIYAGGEARDRFEITAQKVYELQKSETPKTSLPLPEDVLSTWDQMADAGYTEILQVCISSGLSGTYNLMRMLAADYKRIPVTVHDTKTLSMQEGFIVLGCAKVLKETQDVQKAVEYAIKLRENSLGVFIIRTLEFLRKGGRIGLVEGVLGTMLQLKPVIFPNAEGIYQTIAKARGHVNAMEVMIREVTDRFKQERVNIAVIHGAVHDEAEALLERLKGILNIEESGIHACSPVLGCHTGYSLIGIICCKAI